MKNLILLTMLLAGMLGSSSWAQRTWAPNALQANTTSIPSRSCFRVVDEATNPLDSVKSAGLVASFATANLKVSSRQTTGAVVQQKLPVAIPSCLGDSPGRCDGTVAIAKTAGPKIKLQQNTRASTAPKFELLSLRSDLDLPKCKLPNDSKFTIVCFLGIECPLAKLYAPRLRDLEKEFNSQGVRFIGINRFQRRQMGNGSRSHSGESKCCPPQHRIHSPA